MVFLVASIFKVFEGFESKELKMVAPSIEISNRILKKLIVIDKLFDK